MSWLVRLWLRFTRLTIRFCWPGGVECGGASRSSWRICDRMMMMMMMSVRLVMCRVLRSLCGLGLELIRPAAET